MGLNPGDLLKSFYFSEKFEKNYKDKIRPPLAIFLCIFERKKITTTKSTANILSSEPNEQG